MKKKIFISTIKIAVLAENQAQAEHAMSEILTETLQETLVDWGYVEDGNPLETTLKPSKYQEGDIFESDGKLFV